jgi:hypothetical protein
MVYRRVNHRLAALVTGIASGFQVLGSSPDFHADIEPILADKCYRCHGDDKAKGGLRLDSPESIVDGGDGGEVLVPGEPIESLMYLMTTYPKDDPDYMPQKGEGLSQEEQNLLKAWIEKGASFGEGFKPELKPSVGKKYVDTVSKATYKIVGELIRVVSELQKIGVLVDTVNHDASRFELVYSYANYTAGSFDFSEAARLGDSLVKLSLSRTSVTDKDLEALKQLPSIEYLDLSRTGVGDLGVAHVVELANLSYLNLRDTNVSDESIELLSRMKNLKQLYLWGSQFTQPGANELQEKLPGAVVVLETSIGSEAQRRRARD